MLRMNIVGTVFRKELREMLRDRRSLLIMFGVPLVLYPVLTVALGRLAQSQEAKLKDEAAAVVVRNSGDAPGLIARLRASGSGVRIVNDAEADVARTRPVTTQPAATTPSTTPSIPQSNSAAEPPATAPTTSPAADGTAAAAAPPFVPSPDLESGKVDAVLTIPPAAEARALAGEQPEFVVGVNRGRFRSAVSVERKLEKVLKEYERWVVEQRLAARGVAPAVLTSLKTRTVDVATGGQRLGSLMATMLPLFLLITGTLGALFPAINATTTERERGTLETLLATPAGRTEILLGKGLLVLLGGLVTAGLNVASMAMVLRWLFAGIGAGGGGAGATGPLADLAIDPMALLLAYVAAIPTLVFIAALVMVAGLFARTFQEANSLSLPVMLLPLASAAIAVADPPTTAGLLVTPIANTTVLIRDLLTGRATVGAFLLASAASCLYAGLLVSAAARLFNTEQLVNPAWEPLKLRGFGRKAKKPRVPRPPSIDAALALFAVTVLLLLYSAPLLTKLPVPADLSLVAIVVVTMLGLIAAPAILLAWVAGYPWVETFSLRPPSWAGLAGGALVGVGVVPVAQLLYILQSVIWPAAGDSSAEAMKLFLPSVQAHPVLTAIVVGAMAGLCEELLYRGPIQAALTRRLPVTFGLCATAALFSAAHMDAHGFPLRFLLGLLLGYVVLRGGSIFPAMLLHAMYDATQMAQLAWAVHTQGVAQAAEQAAGNAASALDGEFWVQFAVGAVMLVVGVWLLRRTWRRTSLAERSARGFEVVAPT